MTLAESEEPEKTCIDLRSESIINNESITDKSLTFTCIDIFYHLDHLLLFQLPSNVSFVFKAPLGAYGDSLLKTTLLNEHMNK